MASSASRALSPGAGPCFPPLGADNCVPASRPACQEQESKDAGKPIRIVYFKWLELVAVHSDAWLMSVAFFFAAKAEKPDRCVQTSPPAPLGLFA